MRTPTDHLLRQMYEHLFVTYGPQHWWPGETTTEIVVGAILTQNTAWTNVEQAIENLKHAGLLTWEALRDISTEELAEQIRPSGTYRVKAARLKTLVDHLWREHGGCLTAMLRGDVEETRRSLLSLAGVGPETADAILLYAGQRPSFVVDAYTRRILRRHHVIDAKADYATIRQLFHDALWKSDGTLTASPPQRGLSSSASSTSAGRKEVSTLDPAVTQCFNEYHALLVAVGKSHCRVRALCEGCPLAKFPHEPTL